MMRSTKARAWMTAVAAAVVLPACGLLSMLLEPEDMELMNPLGLAAAFFYFSPFGFLGEEATAADGLGGLTISFPLQAGEGTVVASFDDWPGLPPIFPTSIRLEQPLSTTATLSGTEVFPDTITLDDVRLHVQIHDAANSMDLAFPAPGSAVLTHLGDGEYTMGQISFDVSLSGSAMIDLHTIISSGGSNEVLASVNLEASSDPDLEEGAVLEMEFGSGSGRVEF